MRIPAILFACALLARAQVTVIAGATVVDGTGASPKRSTVLIRGGVIESVGEDAREPAGATVIRAEGHTLTPGLFDLHTHLPYSAVSNLTGDWGKVLKAYLYCGVTSVVDFGTYPETFAPMRKLLRDGIITGPRLHLAARITTPGGHGAEGGRGDFFTIEVTTPSQARAAMARLLPYQPDAIKVFTDGWRYGTAPDMTSMEEGTLAEIVRLAHAGNVEVLTHTVTLARAKIAARSGVDVIAHGIGDAPADDELVALFRKNGTVYAPTLAVYETKRWSDPALLREILEPLAYRNWRERSPAAQAGAARARRWSNLMNNVAILRGGGARFGVGTDAGVTGALHGWSTLRELELLVAGGMTPLEALSAATGSSARALHVENERGTIAPGKRADLVLFEGAPHENIHDVRRIRRVFLDGREVDREKLKREIVSETMTPMPARKAPALIDDMEAERTSVNTLRVNATDSGHDNSRMMFQRTLRAPGNHALSALAHMSPKQRPFAQIWFPLSPGSVEAVDASAFRGIQFDARGDGQYFVILRRRSVRDSRYSRIEFAAGPVWSTVRLAIPQPMDDLQDVVIELSRPAGQSAWIELDNLRFY